MKIVLLNPPLHRLVSAVLPRFVEDVRGTYPPLGLLHIAAYLRNRAGPGVEIRILDAALQGLSDGAIGDILRRENPAVVGIQTLSFTLLDVLAVVRLAKQVNPEMVVVLGGRHCDIYPAETAALPGVDYVISGDGEEAFSRLVEHLRNGKTPVDCPGLTFFRHGQLFSKPPQAIANLDALPFPARELTLYRQYRYPLARQSLFTTLSSSRGCPFQCTFCDEGHTKFRARSAQSVVAEMLDCRTRLGIAQFFIYDSTFTVNRQRVLDICELLIRRNARVTFDIRSRINLVDDEMLAALRRAGCRRIQFGVESGNDAVLEGVKKSIAVAQVRKTMLQVHKLGFEILCDFMIGLPGDTSQTVEDTIRLALELPIDYAQFTTAMPYPNTQMYAQGLRLGLFGDYWREFAARPKPGFAPRVWNEHFSEEELGRLLLQAYERFYFRPRQVARQVARIRNPAEFGRKLHAGMALVARSAANRWRFF